MSDIELLQQIRAELKATDPPVIDLVFDPFNVIEVEFLFLQAEKAVENYLEPYRLKYRDQFQDPTAFDHFVNGHRDKIRGRLEKLVVQARAQAQEMGYSDEDYIPEGPVN